MEGQDAKPNAAPAVTVTPATPSPAGEPDVSIGKAFYARTVGLGPAFVESLETSNDTDSVVTTLRKRAGCVTPRTPLKSRVGSRAVRSACDRRAWRLAVVQDAVVAACMLAARATSARYWFFCSVLTARLQHRYGEHQGSIHGYAVAPIVGCGRGASASAFGCCDISSNVSYAAQVVPAVGDSVSAAVSWVAGTVGLEGECKVSSCHCAAALTRVQRPTARCPTRWPRFASRT